jgi:hypothetical protein
VPVFGCDGVGAMLVDVGDGVVATVVEVVVVEEPVHAESIASTTRAMVLGAFMSAAS